MLHELQPLPVSFHVNVTDFYKRHVSQQVWASEAV